MLWLFLMNGLCHILNNGFFLSEINSAAEKIITGWSPALLYCRVC